MAGLTQRGTGFLRFGCLAVVLAVAVACKESTKAPESGGPGDARVSVATPSPGPGEPLPKIFHALPADTVFVLALTDLDKMRADFKQTAFYQAWMDPRLKSWREQGWPRIKGAIEEKVETSFEDIGDLLRGDMALVVGLRSAPDKPEPEPRAAFLFRPSTNRAQVEAFIARITKDEEPDDDTVIRWAGDVLILAENDALANELESNMKAGRSPIESGAAYGALKSGYASDAFTHIWVNFKGIMQLALEDWADGESEQVLPILDETGFDNLASVYVSSAVHGQGFRGTARFQYEGARKGIASWVGDSAPSKALRLAPYESRSFFSMRHAGVDKILSTIKSIAIATGEVTEIDWQRGLAEVGAMVGFQIESELPRLIGNELAIVYGGGPIIAMEISALIESSDPAGLIKMIETGLAAADIRPTDAEYRGLGYLHLTVPNVPAWICMGEMDDFVVISSQQTAFRKIVDAVKNQRSLADNPEYKKAMGDMTRSGWLESFSTVDPAAGPTMARFMPSFAQTLGQLLEMEMATNDLPDLQVFLDHAVPSVSRGFSEPNAVEFRSKSAFGGAMVAGGLALLAVPNFLEAQTRAKVARTRADMRSLATACEAWYVDNNAYPEFATGDKSVNSMLTDGQRDATYPSFRKPQEGIATLTTPIAYITSMPKDVFADDGRTFMYWSIHPGRPDPTGKIVGKDSRMSGVGWIMVSPGPDGDFDLAGEWEAYNPAEPLLMQNLATGRNRAGSAYTYDPTNGTDSDGDIWRVKL